MAIHKSLGLWAQNYRVPIGEFSDSVSYCAEDVAAGTDYRRIMPNFDVCVHSNQPGVIQKVAQTRPGHGPSWAPNAGYDLCGQPPKCMSYGAGRHTPKG